MTARTLAWWRGTLSLIGTIIGAGVFGLPAMFARVGFVPGTVLFFLIAIIITGAHLLFVDIVLAYKERKRIAGYAGAELGQAGFLFAAVIYPLQIVGISIAYILLGGAFLDALAQMVGFDGGSLLWRLVFWLGGSLTVLYGLKAVAKIEVIGTWFLVASMLLVSALVAGDIKSTAFEVVNWSGFFIPFGIFLLTMSGLSVIPEIVELTGRYRRQAMTAVAGGTIAAALVSWVFGVTLFLALGADWTSTGDPLQFMKALPMMWRWLIPVAGFLAVATSFITTAQDLRETLYLDFSLSKKRAWFLALVTPFVFALIIKQGFLSVIDFIGTVFSSFTAILIGFMAMHLYARTNTGARFWRAMIPAIVIFGFLAGMIQKIFFSLL